LGTLGLQAPAWLFIRKLELQRPHAQAGAWEREKYELAHGEVAILIMSQSADRQPVIPAWMPESSHKDVNPGVAIKPFSNTYATDMLPSVALDSGIHAGMTAMEP